MDTYYLPITWYIEPPIDFEHKQYILFAYLQSVDESFLKKILSPHYLYLNKILNELNSFKIIIHEADERIEKSKYIFFSNEIQYKHDEYVDEIKDIIDFSIPQIQSRIIVGDKILKRNKQILF